MITYLIYQINHGEYILIRERETRKRNTTHDKLKQTATDARSDVAASMKCCVAIGNETAGTFWVLYTHGWVAASAGDDDDSVIILSDRSCDLRMYPKSRSTTLRSTSRQGRRDSRNGPNNSNMIDFFILYVLIFGNIPVV